LLSPAPYHKRYGAHTLEFALALISTHASHQ